MSIPILRASWLAVGAICSGLLSVACEARSALEPDATPSLDRSINAQTARDPSLRSLRQMTSRFHSTTEAVAAGYEPTSHCVEAPGLGGMGYHWVNPQLIDPVFDPAEPEVVLYAAGPGGNLQLVAVEYIVLDAGQERPSFGAQPFDLRGTPTPGPHWSLHVWLYEENPAGTFAAFNPNVSCSQDGGAATPTVPDGSLSVGSAALSARSAAECEIIGGRIEGNFAAPGGFTLQGLGSAMVTVVEIENKGADGQAAVHSVTMHQITTPRGTLLTSDQGVLAPIDPPLYRLNHRWRITGGTAELEGASGYLHPHARIDLATGVIEGFFSGRICL